MKKIEKPSSIVREEDAGVDTVVYAFEPQQFNREITQEANDFVTHQAYTTQGFRIDENLSKQIGLASIEKSRNEEKVEKEVLTRLKEVQEKAYEEAYELGKIEGNERAFNEYKLEIQNRIQHFDNTLESLQSALNNIYLKQEQQIMKTIFEMASQIAMFEIENKPEVIADILKKLVNEIQSDEKIVVKLSEKDSKMIEEYHGKLNSNIDFLTRLKIETSANVQPGGCILETNDASINASITQRVKRVWQIVEGSLPVIKDKNIHDLKEEHQQESSNEETNEEVIPESKSTALKAVSDSPKKNIEEKSERDKESFEEMEEQESESTSQNKDTDEGEES